MENETPKTEDELRAENEVLKLKLELEHGMQDSSDSNLPADVENAWLNNVYSFEQQWKDAKRITVYDLIGKPPYKNINELKKGEIKTELDRLFEVMNASGVKLDMICEYTDKEIYKFITEELFAHETDRI